MQYIYKIENLANQKKYVGLTNNPRRRKNRHFYDLSKNQHDNPYLQKADNFNMDDSCTPYKIKNGTIYKDYYKDFLKLNLNDKNQILCRYTEMYNEKPFELLETPNVKTRAISSQAVKAEGSTTISEESTLK